MACNAPVYVITNAITAAKDAGFSDKAINTIVAIAMAESCLNNNAQHINSDGSIDRGILQINNKWHPEVSDSCAYNEACAFQAAYAISKGGTDYSQWATYTSGDYQSNVPAVSQITGIQGFLQGSVSGGTVNTSSSALDAAASGLTGGTFNLTALAKGMIGLIMLLAGLALLIKALTPPQVTQAITTAAKTAAAAA
jgi:hypothetical protein